MAQAPLYLAGYAASVAISIGVASHALRKRSEPGATSFAALLILVAIWASACLIGLLTVDHELRLLWEKVGMTTAVLTPVAWFVFVLEYTGYGSALTKRRIGGLLLVPVVGAALLWVDPYPLAWRGHEFVRAEGLMLVDQHTGVYLWTAIFFATALVVGGTGLLLQFSFTASHLYRDQIAALGIGAAVPILVTFLSAMDATPLPGLNVTPLGFVVSGVAFGNALSRYDFFERVPATHRLGRRAITDNMRDGVVIVDDPDRIVEANDVAATVLDPDAGAVTEQRVGDVFPESVQDGRTIDGELPVDCEDGRRVYDVRESPITDQHGRSVGRVIVLRDVTERKHREQRLSVLNRVLRHNLRNDMNLVDGYASSLAEQLESDAASQAAEIQAVASDLIAMSEKARDIEEVLAKTTTDSTWANFATIVEETVGTVNDRYPEVTTSIDLEDVGTVPETRSRAIVENLVENAAEHNDAADPRVDVILEPSGSGHEGVLTVVDNGPGIPPEERAVLEKDAETPLQHGSGLGLWVVAWAVRSLGGEIAFDTSAGGTEVRIRLPASSGSDASGDRTLD